MTEFLKKSFVQALIAVIFVFLICYMMIAKIDVPKELWALVGLIIGHYYGAAGVEIAGARFERMSSAMRPRND